MLLRSALCRGLVCAVLLAAGLATLPASASAGGESGGGTGVSDQQATFTVVNRDRANPAPPGCPTDNKTYQVSGHITGPAKQPSGGVTSAVLFAHGHGFTEEMWRYAGSGGAYNTAARLAELGHTSVTYNRLGYSPSGLPQGTASCYSTEADVAAQIVDELKSGNYQVDGHAPVHFTRVALAAHSQAALFGELSVARYHNVDAYLHIGFDTLVTPTLLTGFAKNLAKCQVQPLPAGNKPGNPTGYGFRGDTDAEFKQANFVDIDDAVFQHFAAIRPPDPCGFPNTANATLAAASVERAKITVPTLVLFGQLDSEFVLPASAQLQSAGFVGSKDKKVVILPGAGHTPMLERVGAPEFQKAVSDWLTAHQF